MAVIVMTLRSLGKGIKSKPPGGDSDTVFADRPGLDAKAQFIQRNPDLSVGHPLVRANPNDEHPVRAYKVHKPVEYRLEFLYRFLVGREKRNVVVSTRRAARFCGRDSGIPAAMQFEENVTAAGACDDHAMHFCGARELEHRIDNAFVRRHRITLGHVWPGRID
jgi:hypothetical protein